MKKQNNLFKLTKEQKSNAELKIKEYLKENLEIEIGNLQCGFLIDFITENLGVYYYNQAIADSLTSMTEKVEDLYLLMKDEN